MKRILLTISGLQFHTDEGAKNRLNSFIDSYNKEGYKVDVLLFFSLSSLSYFFKRKRYLNPNANWFLLPALPISHNLYLSRLALIFEQIVFAILSRFKKYNIIQAEVRGDVGRFKPKNSIYIVDFHGDSVTETEFRNNNKPNWFSEYLLRVQKKSLKYADHVIAVSQNLINQLEKNTSVKIKNSRIISCGVEIERFTKVEKDDSLRIKSNRIVIGYLGGLQKWQNIEVILNIVVALQKRNKDIFFVLFTNSIITDNVQEKLDVLSEENYMVKALKFAEVPKFLKVLDAGFLIREDLPLNIVSSPTKTAEYLAAGVPVICTQFSGDYQKSIRHGKEGFVLNDIHFSPEEVYEMNEYLKQVKINRQKYQELCVAAAKNRTWETEFNQFKEVL